MTKFSDGNLFRGKGLGKQEELNTLNLKNCKKQVDENWPAKHK